jgi:hypothetical protein
MIFQVEDLRLEANFQDRNSGLENNYVSHEIFYFIS